MCCRKIVFVFFILIVVSDATPWRSRRYRITSQAVTIRRIVKIYTRNKAAGNTIAASAINPAEIKLTATITPIDDRTTLRKKERILHKAHKRADESELVKPLEIEGLVMDGINDWFILDDYYGDFDFDDDLYEYYNEYIEEFWEEVIFEYEIDDGDDDDDVYLRNIPEEELIFPKMYYDTIIHSDFY